MKFRLVAEPSPVGVGSLEKVLVDGISASVYDELNHAFEQAQELPRCHGKACHVRNVPFMQRRFESSSMELEGNEEFDPSDPRFVFVKWSDADELEEPVHIGEPYFSVAVLVYAGRDVFYIQLPHANVDPVLERRSSRKDSLFSLCGLSPPCRP